AGHAILGLNVCRPHAWNVRRVIPEIDIWRAATLILKRYGNKALEQSRTLIDELASDGDHDGADTWRRSTEQGAIRRARFLCVTFRGCPSYLSGFAERGAETRAAITAR